ncbi:MAG: hypothetical protein GY820_01255 [Gammaproteobacteria bacterium]|nr:hypothetical protein [Gammaproteobacteria bacterium]
MDTVQAFAGVGSSSSNAKLGKRRKREGREKEAEESGVEQELPRLGKSQVSGGRGLPWPGPDQGSGALHPAVDSEGGSLERKKEVAASANVIMSSSTNELGISSADVVRENPAGHGKGQATVRNLGASIPPDPHQARQGA